VLNENLNNSSSSEISEISENFNSNNDEICDLSSEFINGLHLLNIKKNHNLTEQAFNDIMNTFIGSKMSLFRIESINAIKFGRLITRDGHQISSSWIKNKNDYSRNNYCIA
ncbi:2855_t:CDS:2, partial [Cetraspora pellucida]